MEGFLYVSAQVRRKKGSGRQTKVELTNRGGEVADGTVHRGVRLEDPCEGHKVVARQLYGSMADVEKTRTKTDGSRIGCPGQDSLLARNKGSGGRDHRDNEAVEGEGYCGAPRPSVFHPFPVSNREFRGNSMAEKRTRNLGLRWTMGLCPCSHRLEGKIGPEVDPRDAEDRTGHAGSGHRNDEAVTPDDWAVGPDSVVMERLDG